MTESRYGVTVTATADYVTALCDGVRIVMGEEGWTFVAQLCRVQGVEEARELFERWRLA